MREDERVVFLENTTHVLLRLGFHANQCGYRYVRNAIYQVKEDPELITSVTKLLYPAVAKEYHVTPGKVERAIRTSIETAWSNPQKDIIQCIFGTSQNYVERRPTNTDFIEAMIKYLNKENT